MGNIVEFTSSGCRSGGVRIPERLPCCGGVGGLTIKPRLLAACRLTPGHRHRFFAVRDFSLRKLNCPAATQAFHTGILKRNLLIILNLGRCLTQFLMTACWTISSQMMNINIEDEHLLKGILKYILYQTVGCVHILQSDNMQQIYKQDKMLALHNEDECF